MGVRIRRSDTFGHAKGRNVVGNGGWFDGVSEAGLASHAARAQPGGIPYRIQSFW